MARFPDREAEIKVLAQNIVTGLTDNAAIYPAPPVVPAALQAVLDSLITLTDEAVAAKALAEQATVTKNTGLEERTDAMKAVLRYAEDTVDYDDAQLSLLGWGGKAAPKALQAPGQARHRANRCYRLEAPSQGEGRKRGLYQASESPSETGLSPFSVPLSSGGGAVASYKIERRERPAGDWMLISLALESEATLNNKERNKDWEYLVIAVNKAGAGVPSNTVAAVVCGLAN